MLLDEPAVTTVEGSLRARKKAQTRIGIVTAAWVLFQQKGANATSIRDVAELAEVSDTTVNNYFATKDELVAAVLDLTTPHEFVALVAARPADESPVMALRRAFAELGTELTDADARRSRRVYGIVHDDPQLRAASLSLAHETAAALATAMAGRGRDHDMGELVLATACTACLAVIDAVATLQPARPTARAWLQQIDAALARVERGWQP